MSAFPAKERRPWESLTGLVDSGMPFFSLLAVEDDGGAFVGFATVWRLPQAVYIEHLAVADSMRGRGTGGFMIDRIIADSDGCPVVVEVELPESGSDASRRVAFYERHGFMAMTDFPYFQPPYAPGLPDVQLMLMTTRQLADPTAFVIMLHTLVYNQ